ncbi:MAG: SagB/ThcOx family dehydrogenase [Nanoarchaeota archaeon]|nr:SagB/ThcOx family dehydrogenase [Nanoarchaeota archaeon]
MKNEILEIQEKTKIIVNKTNEISNYPKSWINIYFKSYPRFKRIFLPKPKRKKGNGIYDVIRYRESIREFNKEKILLKELSEILFYSAGILNDASDLNKSRRGYPSAGARYPIELYLVIKNCETISPGLYHYNVIEHSLELMLPGEQNKRLNEFVYQEMLEDAQIIFILTANFKRTAIKYGTRAYRYVLLDTGHMAQNIYLTSGNLSVGCCTIGGFSDNKVNRFLDLDENEQTLYMGVLGKYDKF